LLKMSRPDRQAMRGPSAVAVRRLRDTPIVEFGSVPGYGPIFNAGAINVEGTFHLFARGVREGYSRNAGEGASFLDYVSDVLVFTSDDGLDYRFQQVLAAGSPDDVHSLEDPRVQRVRSGGREHVMMTYTHLPDPASGRPWQVGVHRLTYKNGRFALNRTSGRVLGPEDVPDKDAVLFNLRDGRVGLIHRILPNMQLAMFDSLDDLYNAGADYWAEHVRELDGHVVLRPSPGAIGVGAGAPPVATDAGLLLFYHERNADLQYTINVALLDDETGRVASLLPEPVMRPELPWERNGDVDEVVFVQGAVPLPDGTIYLTYGAADRCIGAASVDTAEVLDALRAAA
jgi:beta-1,2-mannobiose phosphorylase / 1,2-beta-oligomannan phosphorylase